MHSQRRCGDGIGLPPRVAVSFLRKEAVVMTERAKQALRNFASGCNCAQSVALAYADVLGLT